VRFHARSRGAGPRSGSHHLLTMHNFVCGGGAGVEGGVCGIRSWVERGRSGRCGWKPTICGSASPRRTPCTGSFSFDTALSQRASHGHLRTNPASRAALIRLCAAPNTAAPCSLPGRVETLQRRLRLHRLAYVGVHGADVEGLRPADGDRARPGVGRGGGAEAAAGLLAAADPAGRRIVVEDRTWSWCCTSATPSRKPASRRRKSFGKLVAAENLSCAAGDDSLEAVPEGASLWRAVLGLLAACAAPSPSIPLQDGTSRSIAHGKRRLDTLAPV